MLPKQLKYGSKVESAAAKSSRINIAPQNGTGPYQLGDTIIINIPTRANCVLATTESYLKFTVPAYAAPAATSIRLDSGCGHQYIQRLRLFHGSNLISDCDSYGLLAKMMFDIQVPTDSTYGKFNILAGTRNDLVVVPNQTTNANCTPNTNAAADITNAILTATTVIAQPSQVLQINSGEQIRSSTSTVAAPVYIVPVGGTSASVTYCLNLVSIIGTLCQSNYFPLFACTSAPLRLEIQLCDSMVKILNTVTLLTTPNGLITNVEYIANIIELGDTAMEMIESSLEGQPLQFSYADFRNYQYSYAIANNTTTQVSMPIPAKFSSLKSIFIAMRDKGTGALTYYPGSSVSYGLTDYQFRIGPQIVPPKAINTTCEQFAELVKAIGSMSDLNYQPSIEKSSYSTVASTANTIALDTYGGTNVGSGSFYIGLDLENYVNAPKDSIFSGWNSNTDDIFAIMNFSGSQAAGTLRFDAFALFDVVVVFENGTAFVRY